MCILTLLFNLCMTLYVKWKSLSPVLLFATPWTVSFQARLLCPWNSSVKNTEMGSHSLLQGIFPTQGSNPDLPHCRRILYCLNHQGSLTLGRSFTVSAAAAKSLESCQTLCDPIDGSPPGSPVPGILQARTLEWVAISFSSVWKWKVKEKSLSRVRLLVTPWTAAHQAPPSMGFSSGVGCHSCLYTFTIQMRTIILNLSMPWCVIDEEEVDYSYQMLLYITACYSAWPRKCFNVS